MIKIFIGLLFLLLDVFGAFIAPTFVGYILIFLGLNEEYECSSLNADRTICVGSAIIGAVGWLSALLNAPYTVVLAMVRFLLVLVFTYRLVVWAEEQAEPQNWEDQETRRLRLSWYALVGSSVAAVALNWASPGLGSVWSLVMVAAMVWYIWIFYRLRKSARPDDGETR